MRILQLIELLCLSWICLAVATCGGPIDESVDPISLAVINGRIWTGDPDNPWIEALAVSDERIVAIGTSEAIELLAYDAEIVDARNRLVIPGFIDTHSHLLDLASKAGALDLSTVRSQREFVARITAEISTIPDDAWLLGYEWDHRLWGDILPHRDWIDQVSPNNPAWLLQRDREMGIANSMALDRAGVVVGTPGAQTQSDGRTSRTLTGVLTGIAMRRLESTIPSPNSTIRDQVLDQVLREAAIRGVTSVHHVGDWDDLEVFRRALDAGRLTVRIYAIVPIGTWVRLDRALGVGAFGGTNGRGDNWLRLGAVSLDLDGSLVSNTAAFDDRDPGILSEPSSLDIETARNLVFAADNAGIQVLTRAVGDRANRQILDLYEEVINRHGHRDRRFRVELAQHLRPIDFQRFATWGVLVSALPFSTIHEGRWIDQRLGPELARSSFPFRSLLDAGTILTFGSGWINRGSPIDGIYAAVTRRTLDGLHPQGWIPQQRITVEEALNAYTAKAAYAAFEETQKGSLTIGRFADFLIVDRDILAVPVNDIPNVRVIMTVVGGRIVFDRLRTSNS